MTTTAATTPVMSSAHTRTAGARRRLFATMWSGMDTSVDEQVSRAKDDILGDLEGPIVEIGAGHGSNFRRYRPGTRVIAFEPNRYMRDRLLAEAEHTGVDLDLHTADLRDAHFEDGSVPTVVSVLTLCSVADRPALITEIHRILTPGGRFVFVEHVAETANRRRRVYQKLVRPAWRALSDGCDPCATTDRDIAAAGFERVEVTTANLGPGLDPTNLTHWGVATK